MAACTDCTLKTIYILSENRYLLSGVKKFVSALEHPDCKYTIKQFTNNELHLFLDEISERKTHPSEINYFIVERNIFYILKSNNLSLKGILIPPIVSVSELLKIFMARSNNELPLNAEYYYRNTHTHREVEVVSLLLEGLPQKSIADRLGISIKTVSHYKQVAIKKSGYSNFNEYYLRNSSIHMLFQHR